MMTNKIFSTTNILYIIMYLIFLIQWTSGESMPCTVLRTSIMCENAEGDFLANVKSENIAVINIVRSALMYLTEQDISKFTNVREMIIDQCEVPHSILNYTLSLKELKILQIINSNITENYLTALRNSNTLVILSLKGNNLVKIRKDIFGSLLRLEEIDLSHNELVSLSLDAFPDVSALKKLDTSYNSFRNVSYVNQGDFDMSCVEEYNLSHNKIYSITAGSFQGFHSLRKLDLSYNNLPGVFDYGVREGVFNNMSRLEEINLSNNEILAVEGGALFGMPALKKLDLSYNKIGVIGNSGIIKKGVFDNLPHIEEIDLSDNRISVIEPDAFEGLPALRRLDLSQNSLSDDFNPASLSLPAGCVFQSLVATCPAPTTDGHPSDEHQLPEQKAATDDPRQKQSELQHTLQDLQQQLKQLLQQQQRQRREIELLKEELGRQNDNKLHADDEEENEKLQQQQEEEEEELQQRWQGEKEPRQPSGSGHEEGGAREEGNGGAGPAITESGDSGGGVDGGERFVAMAAVAVAAVTVTAVAACLLFLLAILFLVMMFVANPRKKRFGAFLRRVGLS